MAGKRPSGVNSIRTLCARRRSASVRDWRSTGSSPGTLSRDDSCCSRRIPLVTHGIWQDLSRTCFRTRRFGQIPRRARDRSKAQGGILRRQSDRRPRPSGPASRDHEDCAERKAKCPVRRPCEGHRSQASPVTRYSISPLSHGLPANSFGNELAGPVLMLLSCDGLSS